MKPAMILLAIAVVATVAAADPATDSGLPWTQVPRFGKQYSTSTRMWLTLYNAVNVCSQRGSRLFQPRSRDEVNYVISLFEYTGVQIWVGAWNSPDADKVTWMNRSGQVDFTKFSLEKFK